ncbi:type II toxin-antitoxin system HigB family toxin [Vibrio parahaemolyticus]|uniref:type II toxin-antitoxin system HigB family toxin n=1 Tax=Vibrio parahaemolyticus TaxID=670 RepID=UPI00111CCE62|nr:type II toxin-antitoxin system HigB family toxin [Vibrio parahaemolyticus]MBE3985573.1 cytoplasmic protein [Vibrio parahaemolyticus]MBE4286473.1 cytoplasmic protein [Vibrio parahaemolyticus]MDF4902133.1 type II toxin-antitoxin system HigB family toxin [Vibrio parahaemolyticus]TOH19108.1 cytoplasmic protein [Vibrio parahaemolyticus]HCG7330516.1 type II toxin-antitoxin system HigB family toxin [Vibrio parahaemolyticus]
MHVIRREPFDTAARLYPHCSDALDDTYRALKSSKAKTPEELKKVFPSLDNFKYVDKWYVIDIGGGSLRLIAFIEFVGGKCFIKHIVTHAEYDKITNQHRRKGKRG